MALDGQQNGDLRATLAVSQDEARLGTTRTLNLPGGRQVDLTLPAGLYDGQVLRLEGQGQPGTGGRLGALILTIAVAQPENSSPTPLTQDEANAHTEFMPLSQPPPSISSPSYPPATSGVAHSPSNPGLYGGTYGNTNAPTEGTTPAYGSPQPPVYLQSQQYTGGIAGGTGSIARETSQQGGRQRRGLSPALIAFLIVLVLLVIAGSGLIYFVAVYQPQQQHIQATATAQVQLTGTAQANVTGTASTQATVTAQASQTAAVQAQQTAQVSATAAAYQSIYTNATGGTAVLNDALTAGNTASNWDESSGQCTFTSSGYQTNETTIGTFVPCMAETPRFSDFAYQVKMTINQGDAGGMLFRADSANSKYLLFSVDHSGNYALYLYVDSNGKDAKDLAFGNAGNAFNTGYNKTNTLTAIAKGMDVYLYINQAFLTHVTVNSSGALSSGQIGLFADSVNSATQVTYTNAEVWKL